jgi:hypothetical protein
MIASAIGVGEVRDYGRAVCTVREYSRESIDMVIVIVMSDQ